MVKLVEECSGTGELLLNSLVLRKVGYRIKVFQGIFDGNGLPIPMQRSVEGSIALAGDGAADDLNSLIGARLTLQLEDGRRIGVTIADDAGTIQQRARCTTGCSCC
ncbi:MAG TPA: hypothetical protein VG871_16365 [Vicinamibacterales bacterium]|nr:hypothetical protein [Vicinamibacterales bacterium]